jgi:hypothetical protein
MVLAGAVTAVDAGTSSAPWWGVPAIAGAFLIVVAVLTFGTNLILKRLELARADRSKCDEDILDLSIQIKRLCDEVAAEGTEYHPAYKDSIMDRLPTYVANTKELGPLVEKLGFIASEDLAKKSVALMMAAVNHGVTPPDLGHLTAKEKKQAKKERARMPTLDGALKEL